MYTVTNYKTKKALKDAVAAGIHVEVYQPNDMHGITEKTQVGEHKVYLEGPHYPEAHRWYAEVVVRDGGVVKVK